MEKKLSGRPEKHSSCAARLSFKAFDINCDSWGTKALEKPQWDFSVSMAQSSMKAIVVIVKVFTSSP